MWISQKTRSELTDQGGLWPGAVQEVVQVAVDDVRVKVGAALNQQAGFRVPGGRGHRQGEGSRVEAGGLQRRHGGDAAVGGALLCSRRCQLTYFCTRRWTVSASSPAPSARSAWRWTYQFQSHQLKTSHRKAEEKQKKSQMRSTACWRLIYYYYFPS